MTVTKGSINVYGKCLREVDGKQKVVSPPSDSLLYFENASSSDTAEMHLESIWNGLEQMRLGNGENVLGVVRLSIQLILL